MNRKLLTWANHRAVGQRREVQILKLALDQVLPPFQVPHQHSSLGGTLGIVLVVAFTGILAGTMGVDCALRPAKQLRSEVFPEQLELFLVGISDRPGDIFLNLVAL